MDPTRHYYETRAAEYDARTCGIDMAGVRAELTSRLAGGARVLDLGCGSGRDLAAFAAEGLAALGLDLSRALLERARAAAPACPLAQADLTALPFRDGAFEGLWICASLLHVPAEAAPVAVREAARVLAPGGWAVVSLKEGEGTSEDGEGRRFVHYTVDSAAGLFASNGFTSLALTASAGPTKGAPRWLTVIARKL
jgi:ubiquinone/menaquinone biosynthesis C-methylase UbiE